VATRIRLRHPAEIPLFVFMVVLNVLIVVVIIDAALVLPFLPARLQESGWAIAIRSALLAAAAPGTDADRHPRDAARLGAGHRRPAVGEPVR
jgi:hypothetical protein